MSKTKKINESFTLSYGSREADSGDTNMDVSVSFENPADTSVVVHRLNTWLQAIGLNELVVQHKERKKG